MGVDNANTETETSGTQVIQFKPDITKSVSMMRSKCIIAFDRCISQNTQANDLNY